MTDSPDPIADFENEEAFLSNTFGDRYLYSVNRQLFDTQGAEAVYQDYLPDLIWQTNSLFVVVGTDSGLLIEHIAKHGVPSGSRYLFVELDGVVDQVAQRITPLLTESIILTDPAQWIDEAESLEYKNYLYLNQVYVIESLGSMHAYLPAYLELSKSVKTETTSWEWFLRQQYAATAFIQNQLKNAPENQTTLSVLKNSFQGKTAVLVASGPSLDDILPWIQANRQNILVAAISRSSKRLIEAGLKPDIVVTIDPYLISFDVSKEMLTFDPDVLLINAHQALQRLVGQWRGPKVYMGSCLPWKEEDNPNQGITVTNAAIEALLTLGLSQIVLAGVDLCFTSEGLQYSSGTIESDAGPVLGYIGPKVETNSGKMAETFDGYVQAITNLTEQAVRAEEQGCRLINPAPTAAKILSIEHLQLDEIAIEALEEPPTQTLNRYLPKNEAQYRLNHYHKLNKELIGISAKLEQVKKLTSEILQCLDGIFGRNGIKADIKYKDQIISIEKRLEEELNPELVLVKQFAMREFLRFYGRGKIGNRQLKEAESDGRAYYEACHDGAEKLITLIESILRRTANRIEEENPTPDFNILSELWQETRTPGRALVWQHYHPQAYAQLTAAEKTVFEEMVSSFEKQLSEMHTKHTRRCRDKASLENIPNKAKLLFAKQDIEGLKNLVNGLTQYHDKEDEAKPLINYAAGCIAELENRDEEAINHYQLITEGPLLEDVLIRISHICIQRGDANNALLAIECLAHMSISYVPAYAEVAWHTGHTEEAMKLFTQYLQQVPADLKTYMRLGKLYQKEGISDAARMAFNHVLEQDPGNKAAKIMLQSLDQPQEEKQYDNA